jgi:CBS domain-containing protein
MSAPCLLARAAVPQGRLPEREKAMPYRCVRDLIERETLVCATSDTTVREAARAMTEHACGSILVTEGKRLVGIFTRHDLLMRVAAPERDPDTTRLADVMTRDPITVAAGAPAEAVTRHAGELGHRYLPVVDGSSVIGVVSPRHLLLGGIADDRL